MNTTIIFDVDDTLYNLMSPFEAAIKEMYPDQIADEDMEELFHAFRFHSDDLFPLVETKELQLEKMRELRLIKSLKQFDVETTSQAALKFQEIYEKNQSQIVLDKEMHKTLRWLRDNQVDMAVLTNGPTVHQYKKINQLGVKNYIPSERLFVSQEVGVSKPHVGVFKHIEHTLGLPNTDKIYYIGDSYENDIVGSQCAGWKSIWLNKYNKDMSAQYYQPDYTLHRDDSLLELLKKILVRN
ncbi:HAD family hydrolase [Vagococcus vulneris]|uniref:HAD family hydrolase n=1 Tax=Vagococcus vulneris TaxID=1977869 RepID=A0A429ZX43_9ENTE|nr:HAD family hydrolase [Vagococcus vulneris]RST98399.1 hypothetical protein CBF37_07755 [Vagococcus vulneris]